MQNHTPADAAGHFFTLPIDPMALSPVDRMALADALYDSAMQEIEAVHFTPDQLAEIDRRLDDLYAGTATLISWDEAFARLASYAARS